MSKKKKKKQHLSGKEVSTVFPKVGQEQVMSIHAHVFLSNHLLQENLIPRLYEGCTCPWKGEKVEGQTPGAPRQTTAGKVNSFQMIFHLTNSFYSAFM